MIFSRMTASRCFFLGVTGWCYCGIPGLSYYILKGRMHPSVYLRTSCAIAEMVSFVPLFRVYPYKQFSLPWAIWDCVPLISDTSVISFWQFFSERKTKIVNSILSPILNSAGECNGNNLKSGYGLYSFLLKSFLIYFD